ncbi:hypothetical protein HYS47_02430 [Candidatus Woesearchaeota archaeon]|nr:hypothetical protein [Candidatus Woesearchaeota archaeon]
MGVFDWFRQLMGRGEPEEEEPIEVVPMEVSMVIPLSQNGITLINNALESIASLKRSVEGGMDYADAKLQLMARGRIASMRTGLRKMLDTKNASRDKSEMRVVLKDYATLYGEFSALTYYHETFASDFADLRNTLRDLDALLYQKSPAVSAPPVSSNTEDKETDEEG